MSFAAQAQACQSVGRISADLAIYLELAKGTPFQKLAEFCRISQRTVFRVLAKLRSANLLTNLSVVSDKYVSSDRSVSPPLEGSQVSSSPSSSPTPPSSLAPVSSPPKSPPECLQTDFALSVEEVQKPKSKSTLSEILDQLLPLYPWINREKITADIRSWAMGHSRRQITRRFVANWLKREEVPVTLDSPRLVPVTAAPEPSHPSQSDIVDYAESQKWSRTFAYKAYSWFLAHEWKWYGQSLVNRWMSVMDSMEFDDSHTIQYQG